MIRLALRSALSDRAATARSSWSTAGAVDHPEAPRTPSRRSAALGATGKVLVVLTRDDEVAAKSFRNLTNVQVMLREELNTYDVLANDCRRVHPGHAPR
jgi:large subunit ribosomal protein L4